MKGRRASGASIVIGLVATMLPFLGAPAGAAAGSYIAMFKEQPDPSKVSAVGDLSARRQALYQLAVDTAARTQAGPLAFLREMQSAGKVESVRCFYLINACAFEGEQGVADALEQRSDVESVSIDEIVRTTELDGGTEEKLWHIDRVQAREAWSSGYSGEGVVIGSIDTGVSPAHPALFSKMRATHNWFDAWGFKLDPYDDNGHGTHTIGTAVGGQGPESLPGTEVGIAHRSRYIAAKAFGPDGIGLTSNVLLAMQWMQFPLDLSGNVDPNMAPDVVNNSWSVDTFGTAPTGCRPWFSVALRMFRQANILPVFSVGDGGAFPHSPADLPEAFSVGATDVLDRRVSYSPEGNACSPITVKKPDLSAPGLTIHSSYNNNTYLSKSGTSMSAAQVSGAAALVIQASRSNSGTPDRPPVTSTATALIKGAKTCTDSPACRPRLDVWGAISAVDGGEIRGKVETMVNGVRVGIAGAKVSAGTPGGLSQTATTDASGAYSLRVVRGTYKVTARAYGYVTHSIDGISVATDETKTVDFLMSKSTRLVTISGRVTYEASRDPAVGAAVTIADSPRATVADANGDYVFTGVPDPSNDSVPASVDPRGYDYSIEFDGNPCSLKETKRLLVSDSASAFVIPDPVLGLKRDSFGYTCAETPFDWRGGSKLLDLKADDGAKGVQLPFAFPLYENQVIGAGATDRTTAFSTAYVSADGYIRFDGVGTEYQNTTLPNGRAPNAAIYAFFDDLFMDGASQILTSSDAESFTVEWRDMIFNLPGPARVTFSATLFPNGDIEVRYKSGFSAALVGAHAAGGSATVGLENLRGNTAFTYSFNEPVIRDGLEVYFSFAPDPVDLRGTVVGPDAGGVVRPLADARVRAVGTDGVVRSTTTDSSGSYRMRLPAGDYEVTASAWHYYPSTQAIALVFPEPARLDFTLARQPDYTVQGKVRDSATGSGLAGVPVRLSDPHVPSTVTDAAGDYVLSDVPPGAYSVETAGSGRCRPNVSSGSFNLSSNRAVDLQMTSNRDRFGYRCEDFSAATWIEVSPTAVGASNVTPILSTAVDGGSYETSLPFELAFYEAVATKVHVSIDGHLSFGKPSEQPFNQPVPHSADPNLSIYALWDDLVLEPDSRILKYVPTEANYMVIQWKNMSFFFDRDRRVNFEVIIYPNGNFDVQYLDSSVGNLSDANAATVGIENTPGSIGFQYSHNESAIEAGRKIQFVHPENPVPGGGTLSGVKGKVTAATFEGVPTNVPLANVDLVIGNGVVTQTATTDSTGAYQAYVPAGTYTIFASKTGYQSRQVPDVAVPVQGFVVVDIVMPELTQYTLDGRFHDQRGPLNGLARFQFEIRDSRGFIVDCDANPSVEHCTTDSVGDYKVTLYKGTYDIVVSGSGRCQTPSVTTVVLNQNTTQYIEVELPSDAYGYTCIELSIGTTSGLTPLPVLGDGPTPLVLPFEVPIYGMNARVAQIYPDGKIRLERTMEALDTTPSGPTLHVFDDDDLMMDGVTQILWSSLGPEVVEIEWRNLLFKSTRERVSFAAILWRTGEIYYQYELVGNSVRGKGANALIGLSSCAGPSFIYSDRPGDSVLSKRLAIHFSDRFKVPGSPVDC